MAAEPPVIGVKQAEAPEAAGAAGRRPDIDDVDQQLEAWLRQQTPDVSVSIVARAALRVLPLITVEIERGEREPEELGFALASPVFRATAVSWVAGTWPARATELEAAARAARAAVRSAAHAAAERGDDDDASAAWAAAAAFAAAHAAADRSAAVDAAIATARDAARDAAIAAALEADIDAVRSGAGSSGLGGASLWRNAVPEEIASLWARLKETLLSLDEGWEVWTEWYEARLEGRPANEALEVARATIPDEDWEQGPKAVNAHIRELIARHEGESPDEAGAVAASETAGVAARPTVWLCQYRRAEAPTLESRLAPGLEEPWRMHPLTPAIVAQEMRDGDPVVVWRTIDKVAPEGGERSRGGIVATAGIVKRDDDLAEGRIRIRIREAFPDDPVPRDEILEVTRGVSNWPGQVSMARLGTDGYEDEAEQINALLLQYGRQPLFEDAVADERADLGVLYDRPESEADYLGRSDLALLLAIKLNQAWDEANARKRPSNGADKDPKAHKAGWRTELRRRRAERIRRDEAHLIEGGFVVHVDAPWGGGKTTFANYLARLLNPYVHDGGPPDWPAVAKLKDPDFWKEEYRKPWICVQFNAWRHQHVSPPWWCFYQAIRRQAVKAVTTDCSRGDAAKLHPVHPGYRFPPIWKRWWDWFVLGGRELAWRLTAPKIRRLFATSVIMLVLAGVVVYFGVLDNGQLNWDGLPAWAASIFGALAALSAGWGIFATLTESLLPGTPEAARNYEMGTGDPLERFRAHFARMMRRLRRPVLVVIDDLDRCEPRFVVELLRGIQTILRSPRVVFLILGDRDWIEQAFSEHHKAMKGIDVGAEHSFGARFVEKAIQLSLVLPDVQPAERTEFVRSLLTPNKPRNGQAPSQAAAEAAGGDGAAESELLRSVRQEIGELATAGSVAAREDRARDLRKKLDSIADAPTRARYGRDLNRESALLSAADKRVEEVIQHQLVPLAPVLPSNPRQIKRIINGVALFQEIARLVDGIEPGTDDWRRLAQWVVLMTEYPQTWFTLSRHPGLADEVLRRLPDASGERQAADGEPAAERGGRGKLPDAERTEHWASLIASDANVRQLIRFDGWDGDTRPVELSSKVIERFRAIMPATSGSLLPHPPTPQQTAAAPPA